MDCKIPVANVPAIVDELSNGRLKKGKHTLDSDEEDDDGDKYDILKEDDIEGQEEKTIDFDEDIQITPFNMREELEEGHFDKDGTFIFDKSKNVVKDSWIDNIDWVRVKESERIKAQQRAAAAEEDSKEELPPVDKVAIFSQMLEILKPQESVAKALRRLSKSKGKPLSTAQRWKAKRQKMSAAEKEAGETAKEEEDQQTMLRLTEMADTLVQDGMMEIYEATREKVAHMLKQEQESKGKVSIKVPRKISDDDALDMFGENFDKQEAEKLSGKNSVGNEEKEPEEEQKGACSDSLQDSGDENKDADEVRWEYKLKNTETAELFGPYSTSQMVMWQEEGKFTSGAFCRRAGSGSQFYSLARIEFDLYL
ncbi:CD2 antigen cytoplasmic tail-binding protein 2-like [Pomacea canaliculata]|uniref:CD2 antigen cytoplasmic tail-binding protein 2-like n=1 Tax=Pomacea canaliculata TaxID=400727 RepID=UPI000D727C68|nr:CD2 antigen cytoplasmic tail-binding protein 2-like [Pomacea canaliculata]